MEIIAANLLIDRNSPGQSSRGQRCSTWVWKCACMTQDKMKTQSVYNWANDTAGLRASPTWQEWLLLKLLKCTNLNEGNKTPVFFSALKNGGRGNISRMMIFGHFKQTRTYDASNPAERISIPRGRTESTTEHNALTPSHTAMHAWI